MQLENGIVYDGKIKSITSYGAFVDIIVEEKTVASGMVHISEVANTYVNDIHDHVSENQDVKVMVIGKNEAGKISLSIKKALPAPAPSQRPPFKRDGVKPPFRNNNSGGEGQNNDNRGGNFAPPAHFHNQGRYSKNGSSRDAKAQAPEEGSFEAMMSKFKQDSEKKLGDIKRGTDRRNGTRRK